MARTVHQKPAAKTPEAASPSERDEARLGRRIDDLEARALPKRPRPAPIGSMF